MTSVQYLLVIFVFVALTISPEAHARRQIAFLASYSTAQLNGTFDDTVVSSTEQGSNIGGFLIFEFNLVGSGDKADVGMEIGGGYHPRGFTNATSQDEISIAGTSYHMMVRYNHEKGPIPWRLGIGAYHWQADSSTATVTDGTTEEESDVELSEVFSSTEGIKSSDTGLLLAAGLHAQVGGSMLFLVELRYYYGFNDVYESDTTSTTDISFNWSELNVSTGLGWTF